MTTVLVGCPGECAGVAGAVLGGVTWVGEEGQVRGFTVQTLLDNAGNTVDDVREELTKLLLDESLNLEVFLVLAAFTSMGTHWFLFLYHF